MTGQDGFDRALARWFDAEAQPPTPPGGLDRVLDATRRRSPRPAWLARPGSHWVGEAPTPGSSSGVRSLSRQGLRWSRALILLLALAALVGGAILVGSRLFQPSPLPTGRLGHLAYAVAGDIFVADWDGRNPVRIADGLPSITPNDGQGFWAEGPLWSPDGRHLGYRRRGGLDACCGTVFITDPAGHVAASFPGTGWLVSWSPDSTRVATWVELGKSIGIYGFDGVRQALLTVPSGCGLPGDFDPVWSPDGSSLVIATCGVPLDGRTPGRFPANDPRSNWQATYSPDGARVAYTHAGSLVVAAADGSDIRVLIPSAVTAGSQSLVWSPTGDRIAFDEGPPFAEPDELCVVDVASGTVTTVAHASDTGSLSIIMFSPEGDRILFTPTTTTSLWSARSDGSGAQLLISGVAWGDFDWETLPAGP